MVGSGVQKSVKAMAPTFAASAGLLLCVFQLGFFHQWPSPYWFPSLYQSKLTNIGHVMETYVPKLLGTSKAPVTSFNLFRKISVEHSEAYWLVILKECYQLCFGKLQNAF
ncbi:hypothetical protein SLE2022_300810 [Rubroshorea leprosula]